MIGWKVGAMGPQKVNRGLHPLLAPTCNANAAVTNLRKEWNKSVELYSPRAGNNITGSRTALE